MNYYKNTELAKLYNVSEKTVRNWIQAAIDQKLGLQLYEKDGRHYVANVSQNSILIETLVQKGKKYKNSRGYRRITPTNKFYKQYSPQQVFDIISNLDIHREIPHQYSYFNGGAEHWDKYSARLFDEQSPNTLTNTVYLLDLNTAYLDTLLKDYQTVNVIDIGPGNGMPVRGLLEHLLEQKKLRRYIGIDISQDMLDIVEHNMQTWFGNSVTMEKYVKDINYERFGDLLVEDSFGSEAQSTINLFLFFGSTLANFREPKNALRTIHDSMNKNDLLLFSLKLDSAQSRRYFDFNAAPQNLANGFRGKEILDLLNLDESLYELEQFFDAKNLVRQRQVKLKVDISLEFNLAKQPRFIDFHKGESILLWRAWHQNLMDVLREFDECDFELLQATRSDDQECLLSISKIKTNI